jgi:hypothetical protein
LRNKIFGRDFVPQSCESFGLKNRSGKKSCCQVDRVRSPLHGNEGDFFGARPKKVPPFLLRRFALLPTPWPLTARHLSRKGRGVKDLGQPAAMLDSSLRLSPLRGPPTFFGWTPKKSPFFSAPKKPKKSVSPTKTGELWNWRLAVVSVWSD